MCDGYADMKIQTLEEGCGEDVAFRPPHGADHGGADVSLHWSPVQSTGLTCLVNKCWAAESRQLLSNC